MFVAFFIFAEAIERAIEPPEVKHERLFIISVLGLVVNIIGIFVFQHGGSHGHSHCGGGSHSSHSDHSHYHELPNLTNYQDQYSFVTVNGHMQSEQINHYHHNHDNHHHHHSEPSGKNQILKGVFLHILADTLGSVGVIISALLMSNFGLMIADPLCSMFISLLIVISVYPLLSESGAILMQRQPRELDNVLPNCYRRVCIIQYLIFAINSNLF